MAKSSKESMVASLSKFLEDKPKKKARVLDLEGSEPTSEPTPLTPVTQVTPVTPASQEAAPKRDFTRVANSIVRDAVPSGLFTGKGKQLYDYLYSKTRGAIVPVTTVRLAAPKVMKAAGMSRPTYKTQLARLIAVGLVKIEEKGSGEHGGNLFTVFLPEEAGNPGNPRNPGNNLGGLPGQETYPGYPGLIVESNAGSEDAKTSFKTKEEKTDDDAALALLCDKLQISSTELTGKPTTAAERERWGELADVLIAELKIAAARTTVSSVPAFLAEHLRRRLWKIDKKQARAEGRELPDEAVSAPQGSVDASSCPDCSGSGWWYPEGEGKGVAKCKHEKLITES
jgi:hypothetical protein